MVRCHNHQVGCCNISFCYDSIYPWLHSSISSASCSVPKATPSSVCKRRHWPKWPFSVEDRCGTNTRYTQARVLLTLILAMAIAPFLLDHTLCWLNGFFCLVTGRRISTFARAALQTFKRWSPRGNNGLRGSSWSSRSHRLGSYGNPTFPSSGQLLIYSFLPAGLSRVSWEICVG